MQINEAVQKTLLKHGGKKKESFMTLTYFIYLETAYIFAFTKKKIQNAKKKNYFEKPVEIYAIYIF